MARRGNHYEAAFEDYLRSRGIPYIAVDEQRKAIFSGARVKSFDFLVYAPNRRTLLVDIKGRKFPTPGGQGRRYWENWATRADLDGLSRWEQAFGDGFEPVLVFAYWLTEAPSNEPTPEVHQFRERVYAFLAVTAEDYKAAARTRSPKWDTVSLSRRTLQSLIKPVVAD